MPHSPTPRSELWLRSGLLDVEFYAALRGRDLSEAEAAEDFVSHGMQSRLSPHPFLDFASLAPEVRRAWRQGRVRDVIDHLAGEEAQVSPHGPLAAAADPAAARASMLDLAHRLGREDAEAAQQPPPVDWLAASALPRSPGSVSVAVIASAVRPTLRAVRSVLRHSDGAGLELVVVDPGSPPHSALGMHAALLEHPEVRVVRVARASLGVAALNAAVAGSAAEVVVFLDPQLVVRRGWLEAVQGVLADPQVTAVQPLLLRPDDSVEAAGVTPDGRGGLVPILAGHPKEDAARLGGEPLAALAPTAVAVRFADLAAFGGLDDERPAWETVIDLVTRLERIRPGGLRLAPEAWVTSLGAQQAPLRWPATVGATAPDPELLERVGFETGRRAGEVVVTGARKAPGQLRWSLKLPSTAGHWGDDWGDTHFAASLAEALRRQGQDVVTCRRGAHTSGPIHLDDVSLAIRGRYCATPVPGTVNVLWVISHPDEVDAGELDGFDVVCAASRSWAPAGVPDGRVVPLLQATAFEAFGLAPAESAAGAVFVGNAGDRERPLVEMALAAGLEVAVHGRGWDHLPSGVWRGEYVPNRDLPALYRSHGVVLADHWPDMARHGFIANRVFDAVASGARVICDDVAGLHDVFDPEDVAVARTPAEVAQAYARLRDPKATSAGRGPSLAFDDRARTLLDLVVAIAQRAESDATR